MKHVQRFGLSSKELERKAAVKVLGYISDTDSCLEMIKENIDDVTIFIVQRLQDPSVSARSLLSIVHCERSYC
jgi:hypothetical protein